MIAARLRVERYPRALALAAWTRLLMKLYTARRELKQAAFPLLEQVLQRGEFPRCDAGRVTGLKERSASDLLSGLIADGILGSDTPKGPVSLRFPLDAAEILFPRLFPEI